MTVTKQQFERIAAFRHRLRCYLRLSETVSRKHGLTPQQYQLMVAIIGFPKRNHASVSELAEQLQRSHHSVVELINRTERLGLVKRRQGMEDRRQVFVHLTSKGERLLARLVEQHQSEYQFLHSALGKLLQRGTEFSRS
jgi:DNA-binding MarR family transcriptional regulator